MRNGQGSKSGRETIERIEASEMRQREGHGIDRIALADCTPPTADDISIRTYTYIATRKPPRNDLFSP